MMDTSDGEAETEVVTKRMRPAKSSYATGGKSSTPAAAAAASVTNGSSAKTEDSSPAEEVRSQSKHIQLNWMSFTYQLLVNASAVGGGESFIYTLPSLSLI